MLTFSLRDRSFRFIIDYCVDHGSYQNVPLRAVRDWKAPEQPSAVPNGAVNGTPAKKNAAAKSAPVAAKKIEPADEEGTNQEREDVLDAASRALDAQIPEPTSSKAATTAAPSREVMIAQQRDALRAVLDRFFDPSRPAAHDAQALAPLFARADLEGICVDVVRRVVTGGTEVGRVESARACEVLQVMSEFVALPDALSTAYV